MLYTKEFLVDAFLWRYTDILLSGTVEKLDAYVEMVNNFYDKVGRNQFRLYCSLDAEALKIFALTQKS